MKHAAVRLALAAALAAVAAACTVPRPVPPPSQPRLVFSMGPEASDADDHRLVREAPVRMLSSWYNGPGDLAWMTGWRTTVVPDAYRRGFALHLIVWSGDPEGTVPTPYGTACGRAYPLSDRFLPDMRELARTFAGAAGGPPLYVTLFTEFQTFACTDNQWNPDPRTNNYWRALKDRYLDAVDVFRSTAPNARVSLGWGGWQHRWDSPATGGGRSMFRHFEDVMRASDFQSFQVMHSPDAPGDVRAMTEVLGRYGAVMLAHYKPDHLDADVRDLFTDSSVRALTADGLFAFGFMDAPSVPEAGPSFDLVRSAVTRHAARPPTVTVTSGAGP